MQEKSTKSLGGTCAILVGIFYLIAGITYFLLPAEQRAPASFEEFMLSVASNPTVLIIQFWVLGLSALLAIAAVFGIAGLVYSSNEGWIRWTSTLAIIGFAVVAIQVLSSPTHIPRLAAGYVQADSSARAALDLLGTRVIDPDDFLGFGMVGLWIFVVNWFALQGGQWPKGLAYFGMVGGIFYWLIVAGHIFGIPLLIAIAAALGGFVFGPIWFIWIGVILRRLAAETD